MARDPIQDRFFERALPSRATAMTYLTTGARAAITATTAAGNPIAPQPGFIGSDYRGVVFCALNTTTCTGTSARKVIASKLGEYSKQPPSSSYVI
jgi:hypothetical protein